MAAAEARQIKWGSARVKDGTLIVDLIGPATKAWKARFENVLAMLERPHSSWGEVHLTKHAIEVTDLQRGGESELRHFLESILLQVNSDIEPGASHQDNEGEDDRTPSNDEHMAATFRGFAGEQ